ncbi:MAG: DNA polymerase III subunit alpha [Bacteroidia bacterium]
MLLNCHTYYSFCYGTLSIDELLNEVKCKGYSQFVVSDINNTSACLDTVRLSKEKGLRPVLGIDFRNGAQQQYVGIARNNKGFQELNEHLTAHLHSAEKIESAAPEFSQAYVVYPLKAYKGQTLRENEFVGVSVSEISSFPFYAAQKRTTRFVALQPVTFLHKRHHNAHRLLRAIDTNSLLSKLSPLEQTTPDEVMLPKDQLYAAYAAYPDIIANTERLLADCSIEFQYGKLANKNIKQVKGSPAADMEYLRAECIKGLSYRYISPAAPILQRMEKELEVIGKMGFASYFLTNLEIVRYAQHKNYYYVGRGSGANSLVAYLLRITDVDPVELDLYFERFINPFRTNAPDFDIDFSWTDRDDITDFIFRHFGNKRTALLGTYSTFQNDAVIRELGKVFGLPPGEIDRLQAPHKYPDIDQLGQQIIRYSRLIQGFPSHLSIHSSGIIISEEPISAYTATNLPPKGYPTTQFSMLEAEDIGLYKYDILSQRGLGKIKDSLALIRENAGDEIDIHNIKRFTEDDKVKDLLRSGKAIGCFYVESPAMRMLLAKLKAEDYLRLVAASSIIRPGVAKSGMMREYIMRFRHQELRDKAKAEIPELYEILEETYGVMVYQEDVIKVAHYFAGLSLAEADYLRRGMSWKFKQRNEFWKVKENFFNNCYKKNYSEKLITDIWNQIESFANFAFSKGHSASYAVESYQALFLKAYYPLEYMVATLNNGGGFYRKELYVHEARMHGAEIKPPCVNNSNDLSAIEGKVIYLGLSLISEVEAQTVLAIVEERGRNGKYKDVYDFLKRVPVSIEQMRLLVRAGAMNFTGRNKKELLWEIHMIINPVKKKEYEKELFEVRPRSFQLPVLNTDPLEEAFDELELLGFSLCSPFDLLRDKLPSTLVSRELLSYKDQTVTIVGYMIHVKTTMTSRGERMHFGTFIDLEGNWIDTVHFPPSAKQFPFIGSGCYTITGKVVEEYDFTSIEVSSMKRMPTIDRETIRTAVKEEPGKAPAVQEARVKE